MTNNKNKMGRDSMTGKNNKMSRDSSMSAKNDIGRDSMTRSKNSMEQRDSMTSNNGMRKDSMITSENKRKEEGLMSSDNKIKEEGMMTSDNKMKEGDMMASDSKMQHKKGMMTPDVTNWPEASKMAVEEITAKYGKPDGITADELFWIKKGIWEKICISKMESKHSFPIEHTDMMQTTISYNVPEDKMDDLGKFDGSVTFDRTQGTTMSARCDMEGNNFLALNLANDIVLGKKTVVQARKAYGDIIKEKMKGGHPAYMEKLSFTVKSNTADPDKNTTGLTKEQVTKAIELNAKN